MIDLRKLIEEDLVSLWEIAYSQSNPIWKQYELPIMTIISIFLIFKNLNYKNQNLL